MKYPEFLKNGLQENNYHLTNCSLIKSECHTSDRLGAWRPSMDVASANSVIMLDTSEQRITVLVFPLREELTVYALLRPVYTGDICGDFFLFGEC